MIIIDKLSIQQNVHFIYYVLEAITKSQYLINNIVFALNILQAILGVWRMDLCIVGTKKYSKTLTTSTNVIMSLKR